ncbi:MAG: TonB-dependent receptor [Bacteroidetes bacterium]|nr:TonB-dependent receptor [Bacteroidota bacterium]
MDIGPKLALYIFLFLTSFQVFSQNSISGKTTDKENGSSLPGVNVFIHELSIGTTSDKDGDYKLENLPNGEFIIHYSFVGYQTIHKKVFLNGSNFNFDVALETKVIEGDEVVVSGNFSSTQHDNTIKVSTLGIKQINRTSDPSLMASITEVPGVNMISKGPGVVTPVIRGLSLNNILVLNNSVPMQNFQFSADHPYLLDENGLKSVEIIKGPASLIYGSGAVGGVINLLPEEVARAGTISGEYSLRYFSNTVGALSNLGVKGNQNGFVWSVRGGINSNKDYIQGNNQFVPNSRFNSYNVKADAGIIRKIGNFRIFYTHNKSNFGMAVEPAFSLVTENQRKNEVWYQDLTDNLLMSQNRFFINKVKIDFDLSYQNNNRKLKGQANDSIDNMVDMTLQTFSYRLKAAHTFNQKFRMVTGIQGLYQNNENGEAPDHVLPDATLNDISLYALLQYEFTKLKIEGGLRYSYRNIDVPFQEAGGGHSHDEEEEHEEEHEEDEEYIEFNNHYNNLSASIGATWTINEQNLIRLNLASAFRAPNLAELTQHGKHGVRFEEGNPDLQIQQNLELDLGYHLHTRHTSLDISVFYNHVFNYIHLAPTTDTTEDGDFIYRYLQAEAKLYGGEASLHIHPQPVHWLHILATYSQTIGQYATGDYLPLIPASDLYLEIRLEKQQWKFLRNIYLEGGVDIVFAQEHPSEYETNTPAYNLVNMGFGFDIQCKRNLVNFNIKVSNLLNINYYDHLSSLQYLDIYNMGRNISVSLKIPFTLKN